MKNPNHKKGRATPQELRDYAVHRKNDEIKDADKILKELKSRQIEDIQDSEHYREPLEFTRQYQIKIGLSWGGDADGFIFTYDEDNYFIKAVYYWADWRVYEEIPLSQDEAEKISTIYGLEFK